MNPANFTHLIPLVAELKQEPQHTPLYCLYCIDVDKLNVSGWRNEIAITYHLKNKHDIAEGNAVAGEDYVVGFRMKELLRNLVAYVENASFSFGRHMACVDTVDDFLTDCGEESWPGAESDE